MTSQLDREVAEAARHVGARVAILFGSQVTGSTWAESDLDVAVRWEPGRTDESRHRGKLELIAALTDRLGALGERADVLDLDRGSSAVAFTAIRDGVLVFAASDAERVRCMVDVARRYDDDAPRRELFRRAAQAAMAAEAK